MFIVFMDESGFSGKNWKDTIEEQPFFVISAVCFPMNELYHIYKSIRFDFSLIDLKGLRGFTIDKLGRGFEIKASDIVNGRGFWGHNETQRNQVRDLFLKIPNKNNGRALVSVIDKKLHLDKYGDRAFPPFTVTLEQVLERIPKCIESQKRYFNLRLLKKTYFVIATKRATSWRAEGEAI